jgi:hypothetical protein
MEKMTLKTKTIIPKKIYLFSIIVAFFFTNNLFCQNSKKNKLENVVEKFNLNYIASDYLDSTEKNVVVVLAVTPIKEEDFPPVLSMKLTYNINDETSEKVIDIQNQKEKKIQIVIYGNQVAEKSPKIYQLIKDRVDLDSGERVMLLAFYLQNISDEPIKHLTLWYGMWEKRNQNKRNEKKFEFDIRE